MKRNKDTNGTVDRFPGYRNKDAMKQNKEKIIQWAAFWLSCGTMLVPIILYKNIEYTIGSPRLREPPSSLTDFAESYGTASGNHCNLL